MIVKLFGENGLLCKSVSIFLSVLLATSLFFSSLVDPVEAHAADDFDPVSPELSIENASAGQGGGSYSADVSSDAESFVGSKAKQELNINAHGSDGKEISDSAVIHVGEAITIDASSVGVDSPRYNYVWVRDGNWSDGNWSSTLEETGEPIQNESWTFSPQIAGDYTFCVDLKRLDGVTVVTKSISIRVVEDWKVEEISVPASGKTLHIGNPVQIDVNISGEDAGFARFNYVWVRNDDWSAGNWGSTVNSSGDFTSDTSWTFVPKISGDYTFYIDEIRTDGTKVTSRGYTVRIEESWTFDGIDVSSRSITLGDPIEVTALVSGADADYARFNFVWNYQDKWEEWSSVEKETGALTSNAFWSFTPSRAGTYLLYVDSVRTDGSRETKSISISVISNWAAEGLSLSSGGSPVLNGEIALGDSLDVSIDMKEGSNLHGLTYNFVWQRGSSWATGDWDSLATQGKLDTTGSYTYHFDKTGSYTVYVDVNGTDGVKRTLSAKVNVVLPYKATGVNLKTSNGDVLDRGVISVGESVSVVPVLTGDVKAASYNYVWSYEGGWNSGEWDSTINKTSSTTKEPSWTFVPTKYGKYELYVDVVAADGTSQTFQASLVVDRGWTSDAITVDKQSPQYTGTTLTISPNVSGADARYVQFNYVWQRDGWTDWSSNLKKTGTYTADQTFEFTPIHSGNYEFCVDYYDTRTKQVYTQQISFRVNKDWDLQRLDLSYSSPLRPWSAVTFTPVISGDKTDLKYNYVWQRDNWSEWNSSLNASEQAYGVASYHPYDVGTWVIGASGYYSFYVDVVDEFGESETAEVTNVRGFSAADAINSIERCLASGFDSAGWKYENALLRAGGALCNNRHGWWCANYLWWGFREAGFGDLWGNGSLQVDPEYLANEYQLQGRYTWGTAGVRRGDILFSYMAPWRNGQTITHAAYVVNVSGSTVTVIEGNVNSTNYHTYSLWSPMFKGYARPGY